MNENYFLPDTKPHLCELQTFSQANYKGMFVFQPLINKNNLLYSG